MKLTKYKILLEILIVILLVVYAVIKISLPSIKENYGNELNILNNKSTFIELQIGETNFGLVINKNKKISGIFYFNKESLCIDEDNIKNKNINNSLNEIIKTLIENNYLKVDTDITLIKYNNKYYKEILNSLSNNLKRYNITTNINIEKNSVIKKAQTISNEEIKNNSYALLIIEEYSESIKNTTNDTNTLNEKTSLKYCNNIYKEIEDYMLKNNITNESKNNTSLNIATLKTNNYNPTTNSYYYIVNSKVYAYIELKDAYNSYDYCYNGSIDDYKKGECQ